MLPIITEAAIGAATVETVNARELHAYLENRDHFATWIKDRIRVYGFTQYVDFTTYSAVSEKGGRPSTEYAITLDMGKELAMVERTDRGREARRYFIECERRAKGGQVAHPVPQSLPEALRLAANLAEQVDRQKAEIAVLGPRSEALAVIADADGTYAITDAAKTLQMPPGELRTWLLKEQWIYRRDRDGCTVAYQSKILAGYLTHKAVAIDTGSTKPWIKSQVRVTAKGLTALAQRIPLDKPGGLFGPVAASASA